MARTPAPHRGVDTPQADLDGPSKTRQKAESHALQDLGKQLCELSADRLAATEMPENLRDAILAFRRTRSHEGKRRQMQYVGKLMRQVDDAPLREAVAAAALGSATETWRLHEAERWRDLLIEDDDAQTRWLTEHPEADAQRLRSLVRAARRDAATLAPGMRQPKSYRELFQLLRPLITEPPTT
jgi:ribosome-associated protein